MHKTYLGQKGYTIYKNSLSLKEQVYIREELMFKPYLPKSPVQSDAFPVYRESPKKFYVPRIFGITNFGNPLENRIGEGDPIDISFNGTMRNDIQQKVVDKFLDSIKKGGCGGLLDLFTGFGKTVIGLKIISLLKVKTLIIVHKSFLVNQWIERINQFLPTARIGKIQGQIIDIEDKDIVIGMLQSLSMKEYPEGQFDSFGLTLVDEVHHISAEIFVRALQNVVTKYTLGLSATMNRKDGLTKVFKLFLGDVIHKEKRSNSNTVLIKAIDFVSSDEEFNNLELDWRGNPKFATMMSKLCSFNIRSEFILTIITKELKNNPDQQIILLAHQRNLLTYLYKAIDHRKLTTVGYYLGGMKENDLKLSESKQIILATYSMAAEGLDIKTLTTLILATPKTEIEQAVGRILREKHSKPLIIDIIDQHDLFKKQWLKRRTFYHKNQYQIIRNSDYKNDVWEEDNKTTTIKPNQNELLSGKCLISVT